MAADGTVDVEVTSAEIARMAGVGRAAVSNWRRRYPDFPKPVGGSPTSPTFDWAGVEAWLRATGKLDQLRTAGETTTGTQRLDRQERLDRLPSDAVNDSEPWTQLFRTRLHALGEERSSEQAWRRMFVRTVAALLPLRTSGTVLDPACGSGRLLRAVGERFGPSVELVGQDVVPIVADFAQKYLDHYVPDVPHSVRPGDSLVTGHAAARTGNASAVVCKPPFRRPQWPAGELASDPRWVFGLPAPRDSELAWVQHCYAQLRPNGFAVIAVPPRTSVQPSGRQIRAGLVRAGVLQAVIALPKGASGSTTEVYLWMLRRPYDEPDHTVRMVDLVDVEQTDMPTEHAAWEAVFSDPTRCRDVPGIELLDDDVALLPSRFVVRAGSEVAEAYARAADKLPQLLERIGEGLPRFAAGHPKADQPMVSLGELDRAGSLKIRPRDTTPRSGDVLMRSGNKPPVVATDGDDEHAINHVIEIDRERLDPWFVAGFLQAEANAIPVTNTLGVLGRDDLRRCRIPRMSLAEQQRYGHTFRKLQELEAVLRTASELSATVIKTAVCGLTIGAFAPPD